MAPVFQAILSLALLTSSVLAAATGPQARHESSPKCTKPAVRREWRELGASGQKEFTDAIKCMSTLPHNPSLAPTGATPGLQPIDPSSSRYDDAVYTHMDALNSAHFTGRFLAWHRHFLHSVETILKEECGYKGYIPYWDWTKDHHDIKGSAIWDPNSAHGLGAQPTAADNYTLTTGAFKNIIRAYPSPHHIQRNYTLTPFAAQILPFAFDHPNKLANTTQTPSEWKKTVTSFKGDYSAFQYYIDGVRAEGVHNAAHISLGGDLASLSHSPNDPFFFLLHGQLDRFWAAWQDYNPANARAMGGGQTADLTDFDNYPTGAAPPVTTQTIIYMSNLGPNVSISELLDTKGGFLCYVYDTLAPA